jgi:hypothetical protein
MGLETDDAPITYTYHLASHLTYAPTQVMTVALIKRTPLLDPSAPLATQVHVLNLFGGDDTPYESLHALVSSGVKPWFDAFVGSRGQGKDGDSKMGSSSSTVFDMPNLTTKQVYRPRRRNLPSWSSNSCTCSRTSNSPKHISSSIPQ